jgi:hypothetical protein
MRRFGAEEKQSVIVGEWGNVNGYIVISIDPTGQLRIRPFSDRFE